MAQQSATAPTQQLYRVTRTIKYLNQAHPLANQIVKPGLKKVDLASAFPTLEPKQILALKDFDKDSELLLPFPHLTEKDLQVLLRTKTLTPPTA